MSRLLPYINIRNLFLLSVVTGIIFLGVGIGLLADSYYRASQVARVQSVVSDITSNGYRLALYTSDALTSDYRRSTRQWYAAYDKLLNTVKTHESLLSQYSRQVELINTTLDAMLPTMDELSKHRHERVSISQHDYRAHELIISQIAIRNAELESAMTELQSVVSYEVQKLLGSSWGGLYSRLLALITLGFVGATLMGLLFYQRVLHPVSLLVKAINRLKKGDRQFRPTRLADDEIGEVVTAFNSLLDQRDHAEDQLLDHRASLEKVVDERTADLRGALKAAEKSNKSKSIFLANMSHELRTPMHAILSFSNLARKKVDDEKVLHYLDNIIISGNRLTELLNDLLDLSKLEAGKMDVDFQQMDMTQLVMDTCEEVKGLLQDKGISININSEQHYQCRFDRKLFAQVIMNLLSNAIKFSPESSVITVNIEQLQSKLHNRMQDVIKLAVIDEGVGIPKEELNSVFEQFEQSSKTSSASGGTGLGLSIARSIVHLHKGGIRAESPPKGLQKGSAFIIQIPVYADTDTPA